MNKNIILQRCSSWKEGELYDSHRPVLLKEVIEQLMIKLDGVYVDATFGRGGHSKVILQKLNSAGALLCIDKDEAAIKVAQDMQDSRLIIRRGSFSELRNWCDALGLSGEIDGIVIDLGVSSPQLDDPARGFSFMRDGPLDMRMDTTQELTAARWINSAKPSEIAMVLKDYGEERFARRIANAIERERNIAPIVTTLRLAEIVSKANPCWEKHKHPATRAFQAIRIFINNELGELKSCLEQCLDVLTAGGKLLVISFHSLEDRIVKQFIQKQIKGGDFPDDLPIEYKKLHVRLKRIGKAIRASESEVFCNPRSRSAALRVMEKIQ